MHDELQKKVSATFGFFRNKSLGLLENASKRNKYADFRLILVFISDFKPKSVSLTQYITTRGERLLTLLRSASPRIQESDGPART
jgi:hypothetical protein